MGLQGETTPTASAEELIAIQAWVEASGLPLQTAQDRVKAVKVAIKATNLPKRHNRHAVTLATSVFGKDSSLVDLTGKLMLTFSRFFRYLEHAWNFSAVKNSRTYFLNYRFLIRKMCVRWSVRCDQLDSIKSVTLRAHQEALFVKLTEAADSLKKVKNSNVRFEF